MDYDRWYLEHMFVIAPATAYVAKWLQSFKEFPPRQKPGSFNLDRVMESVTSLSQSQAGTRDAKRCLPAPSKRRRKADGLSWT